MEKNKWWRPLKFATPEILQEKIDDYFNMCDKEKRPYTISWLALHLDTTRETLLEYEWEIEWREKSETFAYTIKKAKQRIQVFVEERLYWNNVTWIIFNLKNNFGWKDKQEIDNNNVNLDVKWEDLSEEQKKRIAERYK